jgi:hemoglobin
VKRLQVGLVVLSAACCGLGCRSAGGEAKPAAAVASPPAPPTTSSSSPQRSLYDRLGGQPAITAVVDEFLKRVAADKRINGVS